MGLKTANQHKPGWSSHHSVKTCINTYKWTSWFCFTTGMLAKLYFQRLTRNDAYTKSYFSGWNCSPAPARRMLVGGCSCCTWGPPHLPFGNLVGVTRLTCGSYEAHWLTVHTMTRSAWSVPLLLYTLATHVIPQSKVLCNALSTVMHSTLMFTRPEPSMPA